MFRPLAVSCFIMLLMLLLGLTVPAAAQEITIQVNPDDTVDVTQGWALEEVVTGGAQDTTDVSRMTVRFPEQKPAVYELESQEAYPLVVDGWLPEGADILMEAEVAKTGTPIDGFQHVITGGDWLIEAEFMEALPPGMAVLRATLRTPGRPDASASHPFYVLEPNAISPDEDSNWFDWEFEDPNYTTPFVPGEGFASFSPPADARVYYVSESGSDNNPGTSEARPLRTLRAAYEKVRDGSGDWILVKAGDTLSGGFGVWGKSGKSPEEPLHIGVYGEGDRPVIHTNGDGFWVGYGRIENIRWEGMHVYANRRIGQPYDSIAWREAGMFMYGKGGNFFMQDCKFEGYSFNIVFQGYGRDSIRNISLYRCILTNAFNHWNGDIGGHSSGAYISGVTGMEIVECTLDRNGWDPLIKGASRTIFNHNLYIQDSSSNVNVRRSIVSRGASHGLQLRRGGEVTDNLFVRNALAFFVAIEPSVVTDNVVLMSDDISDRNPRGQGITVNRVAEALVANNIVAHKLGRGGHVDAINVAWTPRLDDVNTYNVEMRDNVVWNWPMNEWYDEIQTTDAADVTRSNNTVDGVVTETGQTVVYQNPNVGFDAYIEGGWSEFLRNAVQRRRGEWNDDFSAPKFNAYMREGFSPAGTGGDV